MGRPQHTMALFTSEAQGSHTQRPIDGHFSPYTTDHLQRHALSASGPGAAPRTARRAGAIPPTQGTAGALTRASDSRAPSQALHAVPPGSCSGHLQLMSREKMAISGTKVTHASANVYRAKCFWFKFRPDSSIICNLNYRNPSK